ncbi:MULTISPECIES: pitrilysin family protein [unclassified Pseudomonas]|uniref:M16 family metallopeptidase n=1 Tax=unclassified Pseudomonas TaxID=196821 RepID=UPI00244A6839|nr:MULTISPECIES: pitrilysin family protein [unclassified Pseudomonas]MDH0302673.1 insulinase family protein [Pseudomonas sp. GD04091]MDH1983608.1 insulinase family protein [Pseudomonas sp. GD03689]
MPTPFPSSPAAAPVQQFRLANGLHVCLRNDPRAPLVTAQLWYHIGASDEAQGKSGLSHALEHLMFQGSGKLSPSQYQYAIARLGATPDAYTTADSTVFEMSLPVTRLETALEILADSMHSATLGEAEFFKAMSVIKAERSSQIDSNATQIALERIRQCAYGDNGYATPVIGHAGDLARLQPGDVRHWYDTWYQPNNASLMVVGAIGLEELRSLVQRQFSGIARADLPSRRIPVLARPSSERRLTLEHPLLKPGLALAFPVPSLATAKQASQAFSLLSLREILMSRLNRVLVQNSAILSAVRCDYNPMQRGDSLFTVYGLLNRDSDGERALGMVKQQIEHFRQSSLDTAELERTKVRMLAREVFDQDSRVAQAWHLGLYASSGLDPAQMPERGSVIRTLTVQDMRQAASTCLTAAASSVMALQQEPTSHA